MFQAVKQLMARVEELEAEINLIKPIVNAGVKIVNYNTYKHPTLSRQDAVDEGISDLHTAVRIYHSVQEPLLTQTKQPE